MKDQIDRMKRKKWTDEFEYSGSDEEPGGSLEPPTIRKHGGGFHLEFMGVIRLECSFSEGVRGGASPRGDDDDEEDEDEFGGQETLVTGARTRQLESDFNQQETLVIREDHGVSVGGRGW